MPPFLLPIILAVLFIAALAAWLLRLYLERLTDKRIAAYQNNLVLRHVEEVQNIYKQMRGWRHDYHNHIQTMQALRAQEENLRLDAYLLKLNDDLVAVDPLIKSGNVMVDAILNSKLSLAKSRGISIHAKALVPTALTVSEIDLCVILGNVLDNAIEANLRREDSEARFIRVYIDTKGDQLYLSVTNAATGRALKNAAGYASAKGGSSHGFGLGRVRRIIDKHQGYFKARDEQDAFTTELLLPR